MTAKILDLLCCPMCHGSLTVEVLKRDEEIEEGMVHCRPCGRIYPVINGIPRLLPDTLVDVLLTFHSEFFRRNRARLASFLARCADKGEHDRRAAQYRTLVSYSYQWRKFREMLPHWEEVFRRSIAPIEPSFFRGKLGLDAGCGFGRSLYYAASYGAEVIGMDLSEAVEAARDNTRHLPNVHLIQADIFHPPLQERSLDFVYSIGVLHHLPDPKRGFLKLTRLLAPGAPIFICAYSRGRGRQIALFSLMRTVSTHLPLRLLSLLCLGIAAGHWILWIASYRLLSRFESTRSLAQNLPFTFYARYPFRVLHADWFDGLSVPLVNYHRREEIEEWFREANLDRIHIDADWQGRALGYVPTPVPI